MYEMQGPRPALRCWLTDCSAARHCLTDRCYRIPVQDAGCPAPQPFPELPPGPVPSPDTRPECRSPGSPAVPRVVPRSVSGPGTRPRRRLPGSSAVSGVTPRIGTCLQVSRPRRRLPGSSAVSRGCPQNWYLFSGYPSEAPVARLPGRSRSFPRERYPSLAVMNFYSLRLTRHKGFLAAISRFFSHPQDTRSYPPRRAVFPPGYPQIRPQRVEFPGPGPVPRRGPTRGMARVPEPDRGLARFRAWLKPGSGSRAGSALGGRALSCRRRSGRIRRRCRGNRRYRGNRRTAAARCRPRSRPPRAPRR
jgi:hypothetical protein